MNDNVEIIRSNKGGMKIIHRGYMYTVHKKRQGGGIRWRCTQRSLHCKGSISTGSGPPSVNMPHNHIPDPHSVALARCRQLEEFPDIASLLETEYDDIKDSIPLQQRMLLNPPQVQIPSSSESLLQSQPLSPTKLKVTRQSSKLHTYPPKVTETPPVMPPEEVCLRWNSHHSNMQSSFPQLLEKEQYVDVTLIADGRTLKCHRIILSSCSTYFEEILDGITPTQHPVIILKGIPFWILKSLTDFMYVGEVNIDQNKLPELLDVAELLKVKGLAGKSNNSDKQEKRENTPAVKKPQGKDSHPRQHIARNPPQSAPVVTKIEEMPINDPLELLEPKFHDDDGSAKMKENKLTPRRMFTRKIRKRKASEDGGSPPLFPMRRGTRSRPNVKIPKYYDYEDIVKPTASDAQPLSPILTIKSEPLDVEETEMYNENGDSSHNITENESTGSRISSDMGNVSTEISTNSKSDKSVCKTESPSKSKNSNKEKEPPSPQYKIKIKSFSSLTGVSNCKPVSSTDDSFQAGSEKSGDNEACESQKENEVNSVNDINASDKTDEENAQNDSVSNDVSSNEIETKDSDTPEPPDDAELLKTSDQESVVTEQ